LETRNCPSALTLNAAYESQNNVLFSGQLTEAPNEAGQTINLTGNGWSTTATTDANGNYSVTVPVGMLGNVTALHWAGTQADASAVVSVNPPPPSISGFTAIQEPGGFWEFKGTVAGTPDPAGMTITFGGLTAIQGDTATVAADGTFDATFQLNGETGSVTAMTTDWWTQMGGACVAVV
jgi:hypothetical protein